MSYTNHISIDGNLVRDGEVKFTEAGMCILNFSIAHNTKVKDKEDVYYFDVVAFGKIAEYIVPNMSKGATVLIVGRLQQQRWEKDGQKKQKIVIVANQVMFGKGKEAKPEDKKIDDEDIPF